MKSWRIRNKLDNEIKHLMERFGHLSNEISYFLETTHEVVAVIKNSLQKKKKKKKWPYFPFFPNFERPFLNLNGEKIPPLLATKSFSREKWITRISCKRLQLRKKKGQLFAVTRRQQIEFYSLQFCFCVVSIVSKAIRWNQALGSAFLLLALHFINRKKTSSF
jgi:hypothetical protein